MRASSRSLALAIVALVVAPSVQPLRAQSGLDVRPVADHHAHLQSRRVWQLFNERLPFVALPTDLDRVLRDFERGWQATDNKVALAALFTEDGILQWGDDWVRGGPAIRIALLGRAGGLRLRAQAFDRDDRLGYFAGAYGYYRDTTWVDQGRFVINVRKTEDGSWRIALARLGNTTPSPPPASDPIAAEHLIAQLDSAGMRRGVALSLAYQFGAGYREVEDEATRVREENDWVGREVARYPGRLVGFCSLSPLKDYAIEELERCTRDPNLSGLKLHLTTAFLDLRNPHHVERLRAVFRAANLWRLPIVVHMRTMNPAYGRVDAEIFLREVLTEAPAIPVQIAHLAGWGGYGPETDAALSVFAEAFTSGDPRTTRLYFDVSQVALPGQSEEVRSLVVRRMRQIGMQRMLFAVDGVGRAGTAWENLKSLPLSADELRTIAANLAPWLR